VRALPISPTSGKSPLGARLRSTRQSRGMTIDQVAAVTGLTKGFISRVERDETSPSVATLVTLCQVLSIPVGSLFTEPEVQLVTRGDAPRINLGGTGVSEHLMTPRGQSQVQLIHSVIEPAGTGGQDLYTINCECETAYVLRGVIDLHFADGSRRLQAGDALTFPGGEPHNWTNPDQEQGAEMIWVLAPAPWSGSS
jgi:transcriptional regulator with XRE-family HTH domain